MSPFIRNLLVIGIEALGFASVVLIAFEVVFAINASGGWSS